MLSYYATASPRGEGTGKALVGKPCEVCVNCDNFDIVQFGALVLMCQCIPPSCVTHMSLLTLSWFLPSPFLTRSPVG